MPLETADTNVHRCFTAFAQAHGPLVSNQFRPGGGGIAAMELSRTVRADALTVPRDESRRLSPFGEVAAEVVNDAGRVREGVTAGAALDRDGGH